MITNPTSLLRNFGRAALPACIFAAASAYAQVAAPVFSPAGGIYTGAESVAITSATNGASIAFTTDGTIPAESAGAVTHGRLYSGAIAINASTTLSAIAFKRGQTDSAVAIDGYTLQAANSPAPSLNVGSPLAINLSPEVTVTPTLNVLTNLTLGTYPFASLMQASDGNFYVTTAFGGSADDGIVFKMTPAGVVTNLISFNGANGSLPEAAMVQGSDGNFYGTTLEGGSSTKGSVFQMTPAGVLTTLVSFNGANGAGPFAGLVQGSDKNFYGTTSGGGSSSDGTVFKLASASGVWTVTTLASFAGANGADPYAGLVQGSDGNFYGTTEIGGSGSDGTVFMMTPAGALTTLVSFSGANGYRPLAGLVQGSDGNFYGTTDFGGSTYVSGSSLGDGTVFKLTPSGVLTTLVSFNITNGEEPTATLVRGSDGNFYGTTLGGGSSTDGTVFQMSPTGVLTTLVSFNGTNGQFPEAGLVLGNDGNFYGTTQLGGSSNQGVVFQLIVPPVAAPVFSPAAGTYTVAQAVTITSATSGASIQFTTDGSTPTETNGVLYTGPIIIRVNMTFKAIAFESGFTNSPVTSIAYTVNIPAPVLTAPGSGGGGGGAPSYWFLGLLALAGILRWRLRQIQGRPVRFFNRE